LTDTKLPEAEGSKAAQLLERHPGLVVSAVIALGLVLLLVFAELGLRMFGNLNIHYYTGYTKPGVHEYPYGFIPINKDGNPDEEFTLIDGERRIGYFGDSITYGVGAGYNYRIPDILQAQFPAYRHWVLAQVGTVATTADLDAAISKYNLSSAIYLMNLNDILTDSEVAALPDDEKASIIVRARGSFLGTVDEYLRGRSYTYTYVRLGIKNAIQRAGYEAHGQIAYELRPGQYRSVVESTAKRVVAMSNAIRAKGVKLCVLLLPYEMQVSADAARKYSSLGFTWEDGFLQGSTQDMLDKIMRAGGVDVFDARAAFNGLALKVGDAYVFDKGDKIDWNHPNRLGHKTIANWLARQPEFQARCLPN
jgi:hypothetical protein